MRLITSSPRHIISRKSLRRDSNPRPPSYQDGALPLRHRGGKRRSKPTANDYRSVAMDAGGPCAGPGAGWGTLGRSRIRTCVAYATILQTVPFSHSGIRPRWEDRTGADERSRTPNPRFTKPLLCH